MLNLSNSNTQIFASYESFLTRDDKTINGVTQEFLDGLDEEYTLVGCDGCWDCTGLVNCSEYRYNHNCYNHDEVDQIFASYEASLAQ